MATSELFAGDAPDASVDAAAVAAALRAVQDRMDSLAEILDALKPIVPLIQQAPPLAAMLGDSFDDVMRTAMADGIDVERGVLNGVGAALRVGATMDVEKAAQLEALLKSGVFDPAALEVIGALGRSMVGTAAAPRSSVGPFALLKALGDPDVQSALGFLVTFAKQFGRLLREPQLLRS